MLKDDGRQTTDGRTTDTFIYYKLNYEPSAQLKCRFSRDAAHLVKEETPRRLLDQFIRV